MLTRWPVIHAYKIVISQRAGVRVVVDMTPTRHACRSLVLKPAMVSAKATKVATRVREYIYQMA